ncbi:cutinase family protein [Amycolatopsis sp. NBC_01488]|uniref:cutinase family protein n=1 Tax=Amycolatopsis sp. NBC_01488 TaxID=2903563 RepID=UPI002E2CCAC9|nr:cutinase family protein [Amycolatopsis sp. NBC_01488]
MSRVLLSAVTTAGLAAAGLAIATAPAASAASCTDVDVPVARGTFEPGTLGLVVGDPVYQAVQSSLRPRSLSSYPVNYPADLGEPASVQKGNTDLVNHVRAQAAACPQQRFVLVGYSQGANVVDNSLGVSSDGAVVGGPIVATIPPELAPRIAAVLLFGNPIRAVGRQVTGTYQSRTMDYCANGDPVCQPGGANFLAHLSYGGDASDAAAFAASKV